MLFSKNDRFDPPMRSFTRMPGFTFIEVIITVAILATLLGAIFLAVDPIRRINQSKNTARLQDLRAIADAMALKTSDTQHRIKFSAPVNAQWHMLGTSSQFDCSVPCGDLGQSTAALQLGGVNSGAVIVPYNPAFDIDVHEPFSASFWIKRTSDGLGGILNNGQTDGVPHGYYIAYGDDALFFYIANWYEPGTPEFSLTVPNAIPLNVYRHVAVTYNGNPADPDVHVYLDGQPDPSGAQVRKSGPPIDTIKGNRPLRIGLVNLLFNVKLFGTLNGVLDDLRLYKGVLTQADVASIMTGADARQGAELIAYWRFDEGGGQEATNVVDEKLSGSLEGSARWSTDVPNPPLRYVLAQRCVDIRPELVGDGYLPRMPVNRPSGNIVPDDVHTYYAIKRDSGIFMRACLADAVGPGGTGVVPELEVAK